MALSVALDADGTLVTESYEVIAPVSRMGWFVIGAFYGCRDRRAELKDGMNQTLQRLRDLVQREEAM